MFNDIRLPDSRKWTTTISVTCLSSRAEARMTKIATFQVTVAYLFSMYAARVPARGLVHRLYFKVFPLLRMQFIKT